MKAIKTHALFIIPVAAATIALAFPPFAHAQIASAEATSAAEQGSDEELAKKLANPIASLISVPIQFNYDSNIGPLDDGYKVVANVQPVIPFDLNEEWNLLSRTIVPIVSQKDIFPGSGSQSGLGDTLQSLWFSPKQPTDLGIIWGVGPAALLPTATDNLLGGDQWAAGPTFVGLKQSGPWTYGALFNHLWSLDGDDIKPDVNNTFVQPFISYTTPSAWSFSLTSEMTYNWTAEDFSVPINANVNKITHIGELPVSLGAGFGYWAESPVNGAEGFRFRLQTTFLFPR